jgi:hypothetical protein
MELSSSQLEESYWRKPNEWTYAFERAKDATDGRQPLSKTVLGDLFKPPRDQSQQERYLLQVEGHFRDSRSSRK